MQRSTSQTTLRSDIQALRALAVLGVVICHMNPTWLPGGYLGVDVFFVVSGFVITHWLQERQEGINLANFWMQRILRIVPAYLAMLTVVATLTAVIFLPENFQQFGKSWLNSLLFISNQYFASYGDYFSPSLQEQPLLHTWSLAIEMQFYLFYPVLFLLLRRSRQLWVMPALSAVGFGCAQWVWSSIDSPSALYYALVVRAPEFMLGCSLAIYSSGSITPRPPRFSALSTAAGLVLIAASFSLASEQRFNPAIASVACLGAGLVIWGRSSQNFFAQVFRSKWILALGALSYSIYLWHWPILALSRYVYGTIHWNFMQVAVYGAVVIFLAWFSWYWIENQFRVRDVRGRLMHFSKLGALGLVALSPLAFATHVNSTVPELAVELTRYAPDDTICHGKLLPNCVRGEGIARFLMIGDSHAAQLNVAADAMGQRLGVGVEVVSASSCVPLEGFNIDRLPEWARAPCAAQIKAIKEKLALAQNVILAGMWSYQLQDKMFSAVLVRFLDSARANHQQVWVLAQIPKLQKNPRRLVRLAEWGMSVSADLEVDWQFANTQLALILEKYPEFSFFDPSKTGLFASAPFHDGRLIYQDEHHLNEIGSRQYGLLLGSVIQSAENR
jgi:peptidoglycan/LPS O-acetylase OafA/YrhL